MTREQTSQNLGIAAYLIRDVFELEMGIVLNDGVGPTALRVERLGGLPPSLLNGRESFTGAERKH